MSAEAPAEASNITGAGKGVKRPPESDDTTKKDGEKGDDSESLTSFPAAKIARTSTDPTKKTPTPSAGERPADDSTAESVDGKGVTRQPTDSDRVEEEALREIDLNIGDRLEVMWLLEEEDKSTEKVSETKGMAACAHCTSGLCCFLGNAEFKGGIDGGMVMISLYCDDLRYYGRFI